MVDEHHDEMSPSLQPDDAVPAERIVAGRIGARIRSLRQARALSTRKLAAAAQISQPFLSQLERGIGSPSLVTLYRLAEALDTTLGDLMPDAASDGVTVVRAGEGNFLPADEQQHPARARVLVPGDRQVLSVMQYHVEPDQNVPDWFRGRANTAIYVLTGTLRIELRGEGQWELGRDDVLFRAGRFESRWTVVGDEPVSLLLITASVD